MKKHILAFGIISVVILLCPVLSFAAPEITDVSGTFGEGATIGISGSFGAMSGSIVSWDDFEAHLDGTNIAGQNPIIGPTWSCQYGYNGDGAEFDKSRAHSGEISAKIDWSIDQSSIRSFGWSGQGPYSQLYITYWRWMEGDYSGDINVCSREGGRYTCNHKQFYLFGTNGDMPQGMPGLLGESETWGFYNNVGDGNVSYRERSNPNTAGWNYSNTTEQFQRWEFWTKLNEPWDCTATQNCNGEILVWLDGEIGIENYAYKHRYVNGLYDDFRLGHMASGFTDTAKAWFDDLYIATTRARVELGNQPVFSQCTHREIQIPTDWNPDSIIFNVNQGSFTAGQTAYLFVVDATGEASSGIEVTIGESASENPHDIDGDGNVNIADVVLCVNIILGIEDGDGDVNQDGETTIMDVTAIVNEILGN